MATPQAYTSMPWAPRSTPAAAPPTTVDSKRNAGVGARELEKGWCIVDMRRQVEVRGILNLYI
jgi:hypothetical protein